MWFNESVFYQIYTLNFCGAPRDNDGIVEHRILRLNDFMDYFEDLGINAIYFNPVFSSDHHGYDTRDYCKIDERLGTNEDFIEICKNLHDKGMQILEVTAAALQEVIILPKRMEKLLCRTAGLLVTTINSMIGPG